MRLLDYTAPMTYTLGVARKKPTTFTDEIRQAIKDSGLSRYRICRELDLDQAAMSRFMSGTGGFSLRTIDAIAKLLDLHIMTGKAKS